MCCHTPLPLDLHVLSLSLAFILSQDQTLRCSNCFLFILRPDSVSHRSPRSSFIDGTHRYTRFRFLYYLSYYVSILKDRFSQSSSFLDCGCKSNAIKHIYQTYSQLFSKKICDGYSLSCPFYLLLSGLQVPCFFLTGEIYFPVREIFHSCYREESW